MPGFARPQSVTRSETIVGSVPDISVISDQTFYGFRYNVQTGKLILEVLDGTDPVSLPSESVIKDDDYRQWLWTEQRLKFSWNQANGHLFMEVR